MENLWNDANEYLQTGFQQINAFQGLLVAVVAAFMLHSFGGVFLMALGATVAHIALDVLVPVLAKTADFQLPPLVDSEYWKYMLALYVGYLVVITAFYAVKRFLLSGGHAHA
jgi:hypothetical protein